MAGDTARLVRALRIIVGTMALGTLAFGGVVLALRAAGRGPPPDGPILTFLAGGLALMSLMMWQLLPRAVATRGRRQIAKGEFVAPRRSGWLAELAATEEGGLLLLYQTCTILGAAALEGAALFACIAYLIEGVSWSLVLGVCLAGLMLLVELPTRARAERWVKAQQRLLAKERSLPLQ